MLNVTFTTSSLAVKTDRGEKAPLTISNLRVVEDDPLLVNKLVSATINWGDGTPTISLTESPVASPLTASGLRNLFFAGTYTIVIEARNYRDPTADTVRKIISFLVESNFTTPTGTGQVFGPILPRDAGFPNPSQWQFSTGQDILILESSVRSLLLTNKGERIMEPDYGTTLSRVVFEPDTALTETVISEEIGQALSQWEPRVALSSLKVTHNGDRSASVAVSFVSRLSSQPFQINVEFER